MPGDVGRVQHNISKLSHSEQDSKVCRKINQLLKTNTKGQVFPHAWTGILSLLRMSRLPSDRTLSYFLLAVCIELSVMLMVWLRLEAFAHRAALAEEPHVPTCLFPTCIIDEPSFP